MNNDWKTGCMLQKAAFEDIILHANSDTEAEMDIGEIWFDSANDVYKGKNSQEVFQFAIQSDVDALENRMDTAETNIGDLQARMTTAEGEIDTLQGEMVTAQGDITDLQGRMTTAEGEIDTLQSDLTTLTDRVAVQTDTDGHGKMSYLKEQTTEPSPGTDEGVIYTADDGGDTVLYYKANGEVVELSRPGQAVVPGYINNPMIRRPSTSSLTVYSLVADINGVQCLANADLTITLSGTLPASGWVYLMCAKPSSGNILSAGDFSWTATEPARDAAKGGAFYSADGTQRCVGCWPTNSSNELVYGEITNGVFTFNNPVEKYNVTSPPIDTWIDLDLGMPIGEAIDVYLTVYGQAVGTYGWVTINNGYGNETVDSWRNRFVRTAAGADEVNSGWRKTDNSGVIPVVSAGGITETKIALHKIVLPDNLTR